MKTTVRTLSSIALLAAAPLQAQTFSINDVSFWVGTGADSSVLVVDFHDGSDHPSYAWGFLHDGTATGADMLSAIAAADANFTVNIGDGFLSDLTYNGHAGIGGDPDWWSTWSGTSLADLGMNMGIAETLSNGSWFGCSYEPYIPGGEPTGPTEPIAAMNSTGVDERIGTATLLVYPQPASDAMMIRMEHALNAPVTIIDLAGQRVYTGRTNGMLTTIDVHAFASGMYVLQVGDAKRAIAVQ